MNKETRVPTPKQADAIWEVLDYCDEDGSTDVRGAWCTGIGGLGNRVVDQTVVIIHQRDEERRWFIWPDGHYTWRT